MIFIDHPALDLPDQELYDPKTKEFISIPARHVPPMHLQLEHSLISIARWEESWHVPFMGLEKMEPEQFLDYVKCMTVNTQKDPTVYQRLTKNDYNKIIAYMSDSHSAHQIKSKPGRKTVHTADDLYFAMTQFGIPFECEKWHLNRLLALIDVCSEKGNGGAKTVKRSEQEMIRYYDQLNNERRRKYGTRG